MSNIIITIALLFVKKLRFGSWLTSEQMRADIVESIKQNSGFPDSVFSYFGYRINPIINVIFERLPWDMTILMLLKLFEKSKVDTNIPLTRYHDKKENEQEVSWNYNGRAQYYLIHLLAKSYGWVDTYIRNLSVRDGLAYVQEVLVDDQLDREFTYSLSEIAYPYNKNTKKSEFKALPRPVWMQKEIKEVKKVKMLKSMLPQGLVTDLSGMEKHFNEA